MQVTSNYNVPTRRGIAELFTIASILTLTKLSFISQAESGTQIHTLKKISSLVNSQFAKREGNHHGAIVYKSLFLTTGGHMSNL